METAKKTILIIDDEAEYRQIFSDKLKSEGFSVLEAKDGEEGLATALEKKPDMILLDLNMPIMDGMSMLEKLREDAWGKNVKVIILTNISDNAKLAEAIKHHSFVYLVKADMTMDELVLKVKNNLALP